MLLPKLTYRTLIADVPLHMAQKRPQEDAPVDELIKAVHLDGFPAPQRRHDTRREQVAP